MNFALLTGFFGVLLLGVLAFRARGRDRPQAIALGTASLALLAASSLFLMGNRRDEMDALPPLVLGGLVFWGAFVPALATAVLLRVQRRRAREASPAD